MSNERQPLLTEEQIQEMLEYDHWNDGHITAKNWMVYLYIYHRKVHEKVIAGLFDPTWNDPSFFLPFLRGKTKRVLNLDRLRADVKAWVDAPNRKYPEWMATFTDEQGISNFLDEIKLDEDATDYCFSASIIGINPDDYFEEVISD